MLGLMKYVMRDKDDADIAITNAFRKQIAHTSKRLCVVQQVV
jgi:hypothetical protein